jgi:hypothetical protein
MPSFTKYTLLVNNDYLWVSSGEKISGSVHVNNNGVYNEGEITGDASSTESTYTSTNWGDQPGVAGPGVFGGAKLFPVPRIDFNQLNVDILNLRNETRDLGEGQYFEPSGKKGYHIILKDSSYDIYAVKQYGNSSYDISSEQLLGNHTYPDKGVIFVEDNLWVEGAVNGQKLTLVAADPASSGGQRKRIVIPDSIKYTNYDGRDKIGLLTQTDILVSKNAPSDMEIDAAMIAKEGEIRTDNYSGLVKNSIKVYGSMAHNAGLVWTYVDHGTIVSGYKKTETIMDDSNLLNPPPKFPTTGVYSILSWREE